MLETPLPSRRTDRLRTHLDDILDPLSRAGSSCELAVHQREVDVVGPFGDTHEVGSLACAVVVKTVDAQTRSKTGVNELLRD